MKYLQWDLTHGYKGVYEMLLKVKDNKKGAYQAGYLFCYHFEIPDQVAARSQRRGNLAMTEYYDKDFDQLEWELKHSALMLGEDWLGLMPEQGSAAWNVPENTSSEQGGNTACAVGIVSGLAATGVDQMVKQMEKE